MPNGQQTFELKQWIANIAADGALSTEEIANLNNILGKSDVVSGRVRDGVLMHDDYTRKTQDISRQRTQNEADVQAILGERQSLADWKRGLDEKYNNLAAELEASRMTEGQFRARIKTLAATYGAREEDLLAGITTPEVKSPAGGPPNGNVNGTPSHDNLDKSQFVSLEEYNRASNRFPYLIAESADIAEEHQELFGKSLRSFEHVLADGTKLTGRKALVAKAIEENAKLQRAGRPTKDLRQHWEETFDVGTKREEVKRTAWETDARKRWDEENRARNTEAAISGGQPPQGRTAEHSILFSRNMRTPAEKEAAAAQGNGNRGPDRDATMPPVGAADREARWQRASHNYLGRRAAGVPMGQPDPADSKKA
jgi:hypothetical protein